MRVLGKVRAWPLFRGAERATLGEQRVPTERSEEKHSQWRNRSKDGQDVEETALIVDDLGPFPLLYHGVKELGT